MSILWRSSLAAFLTILLASPVWAVADGFPVGKKVETHHFTIFLAPGVDEGDLVARLNIGPEHKILAGQSIKNANFSGKEFPRLIDAFFIWACGVLDMQLYSYKGQIKVARDGDQLGQVYRALYGQTTQSDKGFFVFENNTLYIAASDFTQAVFGHEIAHVITSNFFVVQPPAKVAEVLSGYIEYQLKKTASR